MLIVSWAKELLLRSSLVYKFAFKFRLELVRFLSMLMYHMYIPLDKKLHCVPY